MSTQHTQAEIEPTVRIDKITAETIVVPIVGTAPLIVHRMSEKSKRMMLDRMQGRAVVKSPKDPVAEFQAAAYRTDDGGYGFPAVGFKAATVSAARYYDSSVTMVSLRQFMFFSGKVNKIDRVSLVPILGAEDANGEDWPRMREDAVTVGRGVADLRYRPEFWPWHADLIVTYVVSSISRNSVVSLIDAGGLGTGVGEWRVATGDFGTYQVDTSKEIQVIGKR